MARIAYLMHSRMQKFIFTVYFCYFLFLNLIIFSHHLKIFPKRKIFFPDIYHRKMKNIHPCLPYLKSVKSLVKSSSHSSMVSNLKYLLCHLVSNSSSWSNLDKPKPFASFTMVLYKGKRGTNF